MQTVEREREREREKQACPYVISSILLCVYMNMCVCGLVCAHCNAENCHFQFIIIITKPLHFELDVKVCQHIKKKGTKMEKSKQTETHIFFSTLLVYTNYRCIKHRM